MLCSSSPPTLLPPPCGDEDVQRLGGACQGHVQQIDVVDVRIDQLAVVLRREARFGHRLLVFHREAPDGARIALRLGPDDVRHVAARLGIELPRAPGDQHHALFEPLGLVYGRDLDGRCALVDAQRSVLPLLLPPVEEQRDVGDLAGAEADDLFVYGLQVGRLLPVVVQRVAHDDPLERLLGRQQPDRTEKVRSFPGSGRSNPRPR